MLILASVFFLLYSTVCCIISCLLAYCLPFPLECELFNLRIFFFNSALYQPLYLGLSVNTVWKNESEPHLKPSFNVLKDCEDELNLFCSLLIP